MSIIAASLMGSDRSKPKKRLNAAERRALRAERLRLFVTQAGRKAQKGVEPNDRRFDREVEQAAKRMKPDKLDRLLRDGDEE
jgi:hypothetical protein